MREWTGIFSLAVTPAQAPAVRFPAMPHLPPATVLVTGASTGIGEACVLRLHRLGYRVFAGVRRPADAERLVAAASERLIPVMLDVTDAQQIRCAAALVEERTAPGGLLGLVNNAGIAVGGPLEFLPLSEVRAQLEVNVLGLLAVTQALLPAIRRARGRVINIGSIAGRAATPFVGPYSMSKHAVEGLSDALRLELAPDGIEVSLIEPGAVRTPIWDKGIETMRRIQGLLPPEAFQRYGKQLAVFGRLLAASSRRGVPPDDVVAAVVHALEAERPRTRYVVGPDAKLRALLRRFLPDRANDAILLLFLRRMEQRAT